MRDDHGSLTRRKGGDDGEKFEWKYGDLNFELMIYIYWEVNEREFRERSVRSFFVLI